MPDPRRRAAGSEPEKVRKLLVYLPPLVATGTASAIWTAAALRLAAQDRVTFIGILIAAELLGSFAAHTLEHLSPRRRFLLAIGTYTVVRAALLPLIEAGPVAALVGVSFVAGGSWRLLASQFVAGAVMSDGGRTRNVARMSTMTNLGALMGTMLAGYLHQASTSGWAAGSLLIIVGAHAVRYVGRVDGAKVLVTGDEGPRNTNAARELLRSRLAVTAFVSTICIASLTRLGPVSVAENLSARWVGVAALGAAATGLLVPVLAGRLDRFTEYGLLMVATGAGAIWLLAPLPGFVLLSWAMASLVGGMVDVQLDARSAIGADPARSVSRMQSLQAIAGAAGGILVARVYDLVSLQAAVLTVTLVGVLGLLVLSGRRAGPEAGS